MKVPSSFAGRSRTAPVAATLARWLLLVAAILVLPGCPYEPDRGARPGRARRSSAESFAETLVGKRLPEVGLVALDDTSKSIGMADLAGKVVLVDLWGPWCLPCRLELPHIAALAKKYRDRPDFQLLAITCGSPRMPEDMGVLGRQTQRYLLQANLDLPTYLDPDAVTRRAIIMAGNLTDFGLPMVFLMDRQGVIRNVWTSYDPSYPEEMDQSITRLLQEKAT